MKIEGTHTFAASRDVVWPMLLNPETLTRVMPGCEKLEQVDDNKYKGILKIRVGPIQGSFNGIITLSNITAPESYHIEIDGKGAPGFVKGSGLLHLDNQGETTVMRYEGDAQVGGRLASVGQRLLETSSRAIIRQSLEGFDQLIQAQPQAETADSTPTVPLPTGAAPSQAQFAAGVARNMLDEFIPPEQRNNLITKGLVILGGILLIRAISEWWLNRLARKIAAIIQES